MSATLRSFTDFILRGRLRAIGLAFAVTFIPLIGTVSIIITGLVTLRKGALEGFWVLVAATLPYFLLLPLQPLPLGLWVVSIIAASNGLTWGFAALLNRYGNWNLLLELTALIGIIIVTTAHVVKPDLENWWATHLTSYLTEMMSGKELKSDSLATVFPSAKTSSAKKIVSNQSLKDETPEPEIINFVNAAKPCATGIFTASLLFTALLQLFVARWWQMAQENSKLLHLELQNIRLSPMAGFVFLLVIILSYLNISFAALSQYLLRELPNIQSSFMESLASLLAKILPNLKFALAQDLLPVLYLTFCIAGLSLVHYALAKFKTLGWLWLFVFYSVLLCSWMVYHRPLVFQLVALMALLDVWFNWRERLDRF